MALLKNFCLIFFNFILSRINWIIWCDCYDLRGLAMAFFVICCRLILRILNLCSICRVHIFFGTSSTILRRSKLTRSALLFSFTFIQALSFTHTILESDVVVDVPILISIYILSKSFSIQWHNRTTLPLHTCAKVNHSWCILGKCYNWKHDLWKFHFIKI